MHDSGFGMVTVQTKLMKVVGQDDDRNFVLEDQQVQDLLITVKSVVEIKCPIAPKVKDRIRFRHRQDPGIEEVIPTKELAVGSHRVAVSPEDETVPRPAQYFIDGPPNLAVKVKEKSVGEG